MADLRARQRDLARQTILDACAELVTERRHLSFPMKDVAERAGVSLRTVYNHFATREDLLDALTASFDEEMARRGSPNAADLQSGEEVVDAVRTTLRVFDELEGIGEAFAQLPLVDVGRDESRRARTTQIVGHLQSLMPDAPPDDAHAIAVVLRHLLSHRSWFWLTREYGLTTDEVIATVTWAMTTLTDAAARGDVPSREETD